MGHIWDQRRVLTLLAGLFAVALLVLTVEVLGEQAADPAPSDQATGPSVSESPDTEPEGPALLLPNVQILPAHNISIEADGARRLLRFDAVLANVGPGPLEIVPRSEPRCPRGQRHVAQAIYEDADGDQQYVRDRDRRRTERSAGCMLFHRTHDHWHFDATARYALHPAGSDTVVVASDKVSFCLRDNERLARYAGPRHPDRYAPCERDRRQGISIGWSDRYDATLDGQALPLPRTMTDGAYCLVLQADPANLLQESDEADNHTGRAIHISQTDVRPIRDRGRCAAAVP